MRSNDCATILPDTADGVSNAEVQDGNRLENCPLELRLPIGRE